MSAPSTAEFAALRDAIHASADAALASGAPVVRRTLSVADVPLGFTVAGTSLPDRLLPALAGHPATDETPAAELVAFSAAEVPVDIPQPELDELEGFSWVDRDDDHLRARIDVTADSLLLADRDRRRYVSIFPTTPPWWEAGAPLRNLLHWALAAQGPLLVHAAAVGRPDGAVLIVGKGGSGKSSTALAAARSGLGYLGDDYCAVSPGTPPTVHHLYATAKLLVDGTGPRPTEAVLSDGGPGEKTVLLPLAERPGALVEAAPVRAVIVPRVDHAPQPWLEPIDGGAALRALAPSSLLQRWADAASELRLLASLVRAAPAYVLHLSDDRDANPAALVRLLDELSAPTGPSGAP